MWDLTITRNSNGFRLNWNEDAEDGTLIAQEEVIQDDEGDELKSGEELLWWVMDYFGLGGSRHDKERLTITRKRGDKYMPPEKKSTSRNEATGGTVNDQ